MRLAISPIVPTVAALLLAVLWGATVYAGWGLEAFCADGESRAACAGRLDAVAGFSRVLAAVAGACLVAAVLIRSPRTFPVLISLSIITWVAAEGVLFAGGMLAR